MQGSRKGHRINSSTEDTAFQQNISLSVYWKEIFLVQFEIIAKVKGIGVSLLVGGFCRSVQHSALSA